MCICSYLYHVSNDRKCFWIAFFLLLFNKNWWVMTIKREAKKNTNRLWWRITFVHIRKNKWGKKPIVCWIFRCSWTFFLLIEWFSRGFFLGGNFAIRSNFVLFLLSFYRRNGQKLKWCQEQLFPFINAFINFRPSVLSMSKLPSRSINAYILLTFDSIWMEHDTCFDTHAFESSWLNK